MEIITPKKLQLIDSSKKAVSDETLIGVLQSVHIDNTKLTCCCEYKGWIVCAGFSGSLFFVKEMVLVRTEPISNSIIRCVTSFNGMLLITTDSGQIILFDGDKIVFSVNTDSPVYSVLVVDKSKFLSGERNGTIKEWYYMDGQIVFNQTKATVTGCVFALSLINGEVIAVGSSGKKYCLDEKDRILENQVAQCTIFCLLDGGEADTYYGLSNGTIVREKNQSREDLIAHQDAVRDIAFSPNRRWLFSVSKDNTVRAWYNGQPQVLSIAKDYLYQIVVKENYLFYVDGHGVLGRIDFNGNIDTANRITINSK